MFLVLQMYEWQSFDQNITNPTEAPLTLLNSTWLENHVHGNQVKDDVPPGGLET